MLARSFRLDPPGQRVHAVFVCSGRWLEAADRCVRPSPDARTPQRNPAPPPLCVSPPLSSIPLLPFFHSHTPARGALSTGLSHTHAPVSASPWARFVVPGGSLPAPTPDAFMSSIGAAAPVASPSRCVLAVFWDGLGWWGRAPSGLPFLCQCLPAAAPATRQGALSRQHAADAVDRELGGEAPALPDLGVDGDVVDKRSVFIPKASLAYLESILFTRFFWCGLDDWTFNLAQVLEFSDGACWTRDGLIDTFVNELSDEMPPVSPMKPYRVRAVRIVGRFWDNHKASEVFSCQEHDGDGSAGLYVQSHPLYCSYA